jgi:crotonobetainyl-CoA:carnitine CoA-transferase CaiB-like acyl-CoA transferase
MSPLNNHLALAIGSAATGALSRLLRSFGADVQATTVEDLPDRLPQASFLLDEMGLPRLAQHGWQRARIEALNPALIHTSVTCFGSYGPRSLWHGSELIASAMGGTLPLVGQPDRSPVKEALDACTFHADMVAAAGTLTAHFERHHSHLGQHVDIATQEVAMSRNINGILAWQFDHRKVQRAGGALNYGRAASRVIWRLADGWCFHSLMPGRFGAPANQALSDWMDETGIDNPIQGTDWVRYDRSTIDPAVRAVWEQAIDAFFRTRTRQQIAHDGRRRGINATVLASPADVLSETHLRSRDYWRDENGLQVPGRFVGFQGGAAAPARDISGATRQGPLSGVRVLDFSWALVGSITTKILGDLGAEVIKVESRGRPCLSRMDVQVRASSARSLDDKPWFAHLNSSKLSLSLDLKVADSREVIEPLVRWADLVVENFSPGTMAKLGLGFEHLQRLNPDVILVSGSIFGQTGPLAQEWGVDGTGAALASRTLLTGWPDRDPVIPGAVPYGDAVVPYVMAAAALAALQNRRERGGGAHIDASMYEICVQQMRAAILQQQCGSAPTRQGNRDTSIHTQGVYPVAGSDRWIAICCPTESDWQRLCTLAGIDARGDADERDRRVAAWTSPQDAAPLLDSLQRSAIAAGSVQDIEDLLEHDPQLAARQSLTTLPHAHLGAFGHMRTPISFSRSRSAAYPAPAVGEHNAQIVTGPAGLSQQRFQELTEKEVFR